MDTPGFANSGAAIVDPADIDLPSTQPIDITELIRPQTNGDIIEPT